MARSVHPAWLAGILITAACDVRVEQTLQADGSGTAAITFALSETDRQFGITPEVIREGCRRRTGLESVAQLTEGRLPDGRQYVRVLIPFRTLGELVRLEDVRLHHAQSNSVGEFSMFADDIASGLIPVTVAVTMPGRITDSNADSIDGRTAKWSAEAARRAASSATGLRVVSNSSEFPIDAAGVGILTAGGCAVFAVTSRRPWRRFRRSRS